MTLIKLTSGATITKDIIERVGEQPYRRKNRGKWRLGHHIEARRIRFEFIFQDVFAVDPAVRIEVGRKIAKSSRNSPTNVAKNSSHRATSARAARRALWRLLSTKANASSRVCYRSNFEASTKSSKYGSQLSSGEVAEGDDLCRSTAVAKVLKKLIIF